tara:strand:+ start:23936 stop:24835 length:900 start_codon:yes stop_codon:yes gene_type:complete
MTIAHQALENSNIGAEVTGLNPDHISDDDKAELHRFFLKYGLLVLRGLDIDQPTHIELTRALGETELHPVEKLRMEEYPEIILLSSGGDDDQTIGSGTDDIVGKIPWHSDLSYTTTLSRGAVLLGRQIPPEGGETGWMDTVAVYNDLPTELQQEIDDLEVIHQFDFAEDVQRARIREAKDPSLSKFPRFPDIAHPLVITHPENGYKALNISPMFTCDIVGYEKEQAQALLKKLKDFATRTSYTYIHHWREGDIVIWDNWRTCHTALGHPRKYLRNMHRTTLAATATFGREYKGNVSAAS